MSVMNGRKSKIVWAYGDFQTPDPLAASVCSVLKQNGVKPSFILEPTCGRGSFIGAASRVFSTANLIGVDINPRHLVAARERLSAEIEGGRVELREGDFFSFDWSSVLANHRDPCLILGNPPWVTSAELSALASTNVPRKSNAHRWSGIEALTGKSNFDISEWMVRRYLDWLRDRGGWIAVLVKTMVARKLLVHAWKNRYPLKAAAIYSIDAMEHFGAAVDACLFVLSVDPRAVSFECSSFDSITSATPSRTIGFHDDIAIANLDAYRQYRHLNEEDRRYVWRSGIKHDCSKVMELTLEAARYKNGLGDLVDIEDTYLYPMLKSSDVNTNGNARHRFMLVTQRTPGEDTAAIRLRAPQTWAYLQRHATFFQKRSSSIYRNRAPFSIFGVGDYSFAPWKVAISGFYKRLRFVSVGPVNGRPAVFDDTVYFLPCRTETEAEFLADLLNSSPAQRFYESMIFWSDKRPITRDLLRRLSIPRLAAELGRTPELERLLHADENQSSGVTQLPLLGSA